MLDWDELVTTALLGTDRRPVVTAAELLHAAARHRAVSRSAPPLTRCPAPDRGPEAQLPEAPAAAQQLLDTLLDRPVAELLNAWLAAAVEAQVLLAPHHWAALATLAATRPDCDRGLLALALGEPGRWFLEQNPAWSRLAESARRAVRPAPTVDPAGPGGSGGPDQPCPGLLPGEAEVSARPEVALAVATPWPRTLTVAALGVLLRGQLGWRAPAYGSAVGARMALADADLLQQATEALSGGALSPGDGRGTRPGARVLQDALAAAVRSLEARLAIAQVFPPAPTPTLPSVDAPSTPRQEPDDRA